MTRNAEGTQSPQTAERVGGYRVVRRLATGGTSDVLLAKAEGPHGFERTVVLKLLLSQFRSDDEFTRMFAREASAYARLAHPAIVRLFDFFALPPTSPGGVPSPGNRDGQLVMVLEHVDGPSLSRLRSLLKSAKKELDDRSAIYIASRVFDALAAAHATVDENGMSTPVIHRDVNPSNVLVPWDGHVKLADFGVAKVTGLNHQSIAGMIKGTYGYMAPEQVTGEPVTPRADVYAGAIVLWELLAKRKAFQRGALPEVEALRAMAEPRLMSIDAVRPDADKSVRDALRRALEPRAERRTITAEEIVSILTNVVKPDDGRERLVSLLAGIRSDAQAVSLAYREKDSEAPPPVGAGIVFRGGAPLVVPSTIPNPKTDTGIAPPVTQLGGAGPPPAPGSSSPRGMLPKSSGRGPGVSRMTADYGPEPVAPVTPQPPPLPPRANKPPLPPRPPPISTHTLASANTAAMAASRGLEPPKRPSAAQRLASMAPADDASPLPPPQQAKGSDPRLRLGTPLQVVTGGVKLYDAIDDILKDVPSSRPPEALLKETAKSPPAKVVESPAPPGVATGPKRQPASKTMAMGSMDRSGAGSSDLPTPAVAFGRAPYASPEMLQSQTIVPSGSAPPDPDLPTIPAPLPDFGATVRDVVSDSDSDATRKVTSEETTTAITLPPPHTQRMAPHHQQDRTLAMDVRPLVEPSQLQPQKAAVPSDLPMLFSPPPPPPTPTPGRSPSTGKMPVYPPTGGRPGAETQVMATAPTEPLQQPITPQQFQQQQPSPPAGAYGPPPISHESLSSSSSSSSLGGGARDPMPTNPPPPAKRSSAIGVIAILLLVLTAAGIAGSVAWVRYQRTAHQGPEVLPTSVPGTASTAATASTASIAAATASTAPVASTASTAAATADIPDAAVAVVAADSGSEIPADMGMIRTASAAPHRRIFVEDKVVGQTPESVTIKCGAHAIRLGSSGKTQQIDVPCGGEISVADKDK